MGQIKVKAHSYLNYYLPPQYEHRWVDVVAPGPLLLAEIAENLCIPRQEVVLITVNGRRLPWDSKAYPGDVVEFFPYIGGG